MHIEYLRGLAATGETVDIRLLPGDFPRAIRRMLVTPTPVVRPVEGAIQEWYDHSLLLSQSTQELRVLATILRQRHEQWMEGLIRESPVVHKQLVRLGFNVDSVSRVVDPNE